MEEKVITGNVFDKYNVKNPIYKKLMKGFDDAIFGFIGKVISDTGENIKILEIGCGEGLLGEKILRIHKKVSYTGLDIENDILEEAKANCPNGAFFIGSAYQLDEFKEQQYDLIIVSEVLEHLEHPGKALDNIETLSSKYFIYSVPREPVWRVLNIIRLKYINKLGNTPGHIKHWSKRGFKKMISNHFKVIDFVTPFPWSMALCEKKSPYKK